MRRGEIKDRADASYFALSDSLVHSKFPLSSIGEHFWVRDGDHARLPEKDVVTDGGVRYLRAQDLKDGAIDNSAPIYVTRNYFGTLGRSHIKPGYLLFSIMASIGNCAVVPEGYPDATANRAVGILAPRPEQQVMTAYVAFLFETELGARLYERIKKGGLQQRTNLADVTRLQFPLPPLDKQRDLLATMEMAREERRAKLAEADALLSGLDSYLLETLGLPAPPIPRKIFSIRFSTVAGKRLDPPAYQPLINETAQGDIALRDLRDLADIDSHTADKPASENELVPYIGLPECDLTEVREVAMRPYREVKGRSVVRPGDILFARIEPSVFNKKYVLTEDLQGSDFAYTSTEFYVVTPRANRVTSEYLYAMFFCSFVFAQTRGKTTGSSGRRRLDAEMFRTLQIPVPDKKLQQSIAVEVRRRRERARALRAEAEAGWLEAKRWFEEQLLGPSR